jgi:thiosulfate/3-mercaptopyruvate sulfurtransferase
MFRLGLCLASLGVIAACGADTGADRCVGLTAAECSDPGTGLPTGNDVVVDAEWLLERMGDASLQLVDARGAAYERSRIPGAVSLVPGDVADTIDGIRGQLIPAELAEPTLRARGLRGGTTAVVYGGSPEYDPARIVWALRYYGHGDVRYLDGGFDAYVAAGGAVDESAPAVEPSDYAIDKVVESLRVTGDHVREQIGEEPHNDPLIQLVDARSEGEFEAGAIPTARSVNWTRNLSRGFLLPEENLDVLYAGLDRASPVVTYCATGQRGSFAWLVLLALGFDDVALYDGSWTEWSTFE